VPVALVCLLNARLNVGRRPNQSGSTLILRDGERAALPDKTPAIERSVGEEKEAWMASTDAHVVKFQHQSRGHDLEQNIGRLKSDERMQCPGCGIGIGLDTNRLANAAREMHKALEKVPPEITIKFHR
jgi:hypothetical protein